MTMETAVTGGGGEFPLRYEVEYPERLSRWLIFRQVAAGDPSYIDRLRAQRRGGGHLGYRLLRHPVHDTISTKPL